jgi:glucose-6-phosphate dehydrogenase assembly protein OpcA
MKDYYGEINKALLSYEEGKPWHDKSLDWIADRIDWCNKWKKLTYAEVEELAERVTELFERNI